VTGRIFKCTGEVKVEINLFNSATDCSLFVTPDNEIGFPIILGMDSLLAMNFQIMDQNGIEQMNPIYTIPGEENKLDKPRPVLSTGLEISLVSQEWAAQSGYQIQPAVAGTTFMDKTTNTTLPIFGKMIIPVSTNRYMRFHISNIKTHFVFGMDTLRILQAYLKLPSGKVMWKREPHPHRNLPTCPKCQTIGHVASNCNIPTDSSEEEEEEEEEPPRERPQTPTCHRCQTQGHLPSQCEGPCLPEGAKETN
jgi:hypothetical protein